jgi:deazaflavin-dependent oxidoreductase (nitroreductase family)
MAPPNNRPMIKTTTAINRFLFQLSNGRIGGRFGKVEILLLTTKGRKSGQARTTPLQYFRDGDDIVLVLSNAGDDHHPAWWLNLQANPNGAVQIGGEKTKVEARKATPDEKARIWPDVTAIYPGYDEYQTRTTREIPLVLLRPR